MAFFFEGIQKVYMKQIPVTNPFVPQHTKGKAVDLEQTVTENSTREAIATFKKACERLLTPSSWHQLSGVASADFKLSGAGNSPDQQSRASVNDYFKIDIPGPGPAAGDGYDWVQVENITENADASAEESLGMILRASVNPHKPDEGTAHFFKDGATSTFIIKRNGVAVTASYHGRNEEANTKGVNLKDKIRNTLVSIGALGGISELQWTSLIKGLLER